jgi:hypothetical protein
MAGPSGRHAVSGFGGRFLIFYVLLGAVLAAAVTGLIMVALQPGAPKPPKWSTWRPAGGNSQKVAQEVSDHIAGSYHLNAAGDQLVAIVPGKPEVTRNTAITSVTTIGIRASPTAQVLSRVVPTKGAIQVQFCGLGAACAISRGTPTAARERLVRREALELALYTFKYAPAVNSVIAYMPPPPGQTASTLLYLERSNLANELKQPLSRTLPLAKPPLPSQPDPKEAATIDRLTLPVEYGFQYQTLTSDSVGMILTPTSS